MGSLYGSRKTIKGVPFLGVPGIPGPDAYDAEVVQAGMGWDRIHRFKVVKKEGS